MLIFWPSSLVQNLHLEMINNDFWKLIFYRIERFHTVETPLISILKCFESNPEDVEVFVNPFTGQEHLNSLFWFGKLVWSFGENIEVMDCKLSPEIW